MVATMHRRNLHLSLPTFAIVLACACHGPRNGTHDSGVDAPDAASLPDGGAGGGEANIREALDCGTPNGVGGAAVAGDLQLYEVDTSVFPDALCNDGTPAVLYYRPFRGDANRNRWVVSLRGGGGCGNGESCAGRWCGCGNRGTPSCDYTDYSTNFNLNNMSGGGSRNQDGAGVQRRDGDPNPFADYNHVQLIYCSSDEWAGNARGVTYTVTHPRTGAEVTYTMHFLGAQILAADLAILRQDGVPALQYTAGGAAVPMPDLDEAETVVVVGDSGGGAGVIHHLDGIAELLRANHVGGGAGPDVVGIIDAIVGPDQSRLDWTNNPASSAGITTYADAMAALARTPANAGIHQDASCVAWHQAHRPGSEGECSDLSHVVRNHITTPFFVRMALFDSLISSVYGSSGLADPDLGPFVLGGPMNNLPLVFAQVLQRELADFPNLPSTAEDGADMSTAPGVFAPACPRHDTIHRDDEVYGTSIDPTGTDPLYFFDVFANWRAGADYGVVLTTDPARADTMCGS